MPSVGSDAPANFQFDCSRPDRNGDFLSEWAGARAPRKGLYRPDLEHLAAGLRPSFQPLDGLEPRTDWTSAPLPRG